MGFEENIEIVMEKKVEDLFEKEEPEAQLETDYEDGELMLENMLSEGEYLEQTALMNVQEAVDVIPESRPRSKILNDLHEAQAKYDYNSRRIAAMIGTDGQCMAKGQYERAAASWKRRVQSLMKELKNCDNGD